MRRNALVATLVLALLGCQKSDNVQRFPVNGEVTYEGKIIPAGVLIFAPDKAGGHPGGPGVFVNFQNGKFSVDRSNGVTPGPHTVTIEGYDGKTSSDDIAANNLGTPLFPLYETKHTFPAEKSSVKFDVPKAGE